MIFTSAARNADAEASSSVFRTAIDSTVGGADATGTDTGAKDTVFFVALFGAEADCADCDEVACSELVEVVAAGCVTGSVEEAFGIIIVEVRETVALPKKATIEMPTTRAAMMPRYGVKRGMFIRYSKNGILTTMRD